MTKRELKRIYGEYRKYYQEKVRREAVGYKFNFLNDAYQDWVTETYGQAVWDNLVTMYEDRAWLVEYIVQKRQKTNDVVFSLTELAPCNCDDSFFGIKCYLHDIYIPDMIRAESELYTYHYSRVDVASIP